MVRLRRHDPLLTLTDVCERLSVSPSTFYDWRQAHKAPPCIRLPNGQLRIAESTLNAWLAEHADAS